MIDAQDIPCRNLGTWTYVTRSGARVEEYLDEYELNPTAATIWLLCDGEASAHHIALRLAAEYGEPYDRCLDDVCGFLEQLEAARLVEMHVGAQLSIDGGAMHY
jgi:Coenzyme PQQ synthesis protein D (PqqD)